MKSTLVQTMKEKLMQPAFEHKAPTAERLSDPVVDTPSWTSTRSTRMFWLCLKAMPTNFYFQVFKMSLLTS